MSTQTPTLNPKGLDEFLGPNAGYVIEQYERYLRDPKSVPAATRAWFSTWTAPPAGAVEARAPALPAVVGT